MIIYQQTYDTLTLALKQNNQIYVKLTLKCHENENPNVRIFSPLNLQYSLDLQYVNE